MGKRRPARRRTSAPSRSDMAVSFKGTTHEHGVVVGSFRHLHLPTMYFVSTTENFSFDEHAMRQRYYTIGCSGYACLVGLCRAQSAGSPSISQSIGSTFTVNGPTYFQASTTLALISSTCGISRASITRMPLQVHGPMGGVLILSLGTIPDCSVAVESLIYSNKSMTIMPRYAHSIPLCCLVMLEGKY